MQNTRNIKSETAQPTAGGTLAGRVVAAYQRLPREGRRWMRMGWALPGRLGEKHPEAADALIDAIEHDPQAAGFAPGGPDADFFQTMNLLLCPEGG